VWQDLLAFAFTIGAPPDQFEPAGQRWGLPPWIPSRLRDRGYRPFAELLRSAMGHGGGLRIDHVMGLERLFWIPEDGEPSDGAYVRFPGGHLLEVAALESTRAGALVIGEDLGTVEAGFRDLLRDRGIHSTRVLWFEDAPPRDWPALAMATVTTHDLPTLAGMVSGQDSPPPMRARLEQLIGEVDGRDVRPEVHRRLGASACNLAVATLEDLVGVVARPNRPGTTEPRNWSVSLPATVEQVIEDPGVLQALRALRSGRRQ
jgi:4-alpha-glucanotransferase